MRTLRCLLVAACLALAGLTGSHSNTAHAEKIQVRVCTTTYTALRNGSLGFAAYGHTTCHEVWREKQTLKRTPARMLPTCYGALVTRWSADVEYWSAVRHLPADLVAAIILHESAGEPDVTSSTGAAGLMQIEPYTASGLGYDGNLYDPAYNVEVGTAVLGYYFNIEGGNQFAALEAYSAGPGNLAGGYPYAVGIQSLECAS